MHTFTVRRLLLIALVGATAGCEDLLEPRVVIKQWELGTRASHWVTGFADHPVEKEQDWQLAAYLKPLPAPLDTTRSGLYFTARNHSDDLLLYFMRRVEGLEAGVMYDLEFDIELASNAAAGCPGAGGSPGDAQWLKVGATSFQPVLTIDENHFRLSADLGAQAQDGRHGVGIGTIGVANACLDQQFQMKQLATATKQPFARADRNGHLWIIIGVDSGYEGLMQVYFTSLRVTLTPRE